MTLDEIEGYIKNGIDLDTVAENEIRKDGMAATNIFDEFKFYAVADLTEAERKPPEFIVENMIPVGMTFLSGAPKIRKSFMALQLAAAVATGGEFLGHKTTKCSVAYLDLEGSKSRISARSERMALNLPNNLFITHRVEVKIADGLIDMIRELHHQRPDIRLVIIDTYSRARGSVRVSGANAYDADVQLLEPVQQAAIDENIAILFVHHDKKNAGLVTDTFERLSGTMGISGSADSVLSLVSDGKRFDGRATLEYTPRDAKGGEMKLEFDECTCEWGIPTITTADILGNPVVRWCSDNAPEKGAAGAFFPYDLVFKAAYGVPSEIAGDKVRQMILENRSALYTELGVAVQTGVKSHGERGIRLMRIF